MQAMKALLAALVGVALFSLLAPAFGAAATPPQAAGRIYADNELWATFATTNLPPGPTHSFDQLYAFPGTSLVEVSDAAPTSVGYHGGRWEVHDVTFAAGVNPVQYTNAQAILDAAAAGQLTISGPVMYFDCPLFPL